MTLIIRTLSEVERFLDAFKDLSPELQSKLTTEFGERFSNLRGRLGIARRKAEEIAAEMTTGRKAS